MANDRKVLSVGISIDGADQARKQLEDLGAAGAQAGKKLESAFAKSGIGQNFSAQIGKAKTAFSQAVVSINRLKESFSGVQSAANTFGNGISSIEKGVGRLTKTIGLVTVAFTGLGYGITRVATSAADSAESIEKQAQAFGLTFQEAQRLGNVIREVGGDEGLLEKALTKFTAGLNGTSDAAEKAQDKIEKLRKEWGEASNAAGSYANRMKVDAKFREKIAEQTKELAKEQSKFNDVTQDGLPGLIQYANRLQAMGDSQVQLARVVEDFGARGAPTMLAFLQSISGEFDETTNSANKMLPALDALGQANLGDLDQSGDRLATNFQRLQLLIGSRIAPAFTALFDVIREGLGTVGPQIADALGGVAETLANLILKNKDSIIEFVREMGAQFVNLAQNVQKSLASLGSGDTNNWIISLKNNIVGTITFITGVINNVLIPAFSAISMALEPVAKAINGLFGTKFTGASLATVAVLFRVTGAFDALVGITKLAYAPLKAIFFLFRDGRLWLTTATTAILGIGRAITIAGGGLIAFAAANPLVLAIAAALVIAGGAAVYLATRQTEAEKAATAHADALQRLNQIRGEVDAGIEGSTQKLEDWKNAQLAAGEAAILTAEAQLAIAQQDLDEIVFAAGQLGAEYLENNVHIQTAARYVREQSAALAQAKKNLQDQMGAYVDAKEAAQNVADATREITDASATAAAETNKIADGFKRIMVRGPDGFERAFDVPTDKLIQAQIETKKLEEALKRPGEGGTLLDEARTQAEQFLARMQQVSASYEGVITTLKSSTATLRQDFESAFESMALKAETAFARIKASLSSVNPEDQDRAPVAADPAILVEPYRIASAQINAIMSELSSSVTAVFSNLSSAISELWAASLANVVQVANNTASAITVAFSKIGTESVVAALQQLRVTFGLIAKSIATLWDNAMGSVVDSTQSMARVVVQVVNQLRTAVLSLLAAIARARSEAAAASSAPQGRAVGGFISGPGTGTSDSIPARLSNGEFVLRARAVRKWGLDFLYALNNMRMPQFADGGLVNAYAPAFSPSFAASALPRARSDAMRPAVININGQSIEGGLFPASALAQLGKAAQMSRLAAGGRRPAWSK